MAIGSLCNNPDCVKSVWGTNLHVGRDSWSLHAEVGKTKHDLSVGGQQNIICWQLCLVRENILNLKLVIVSHGCKVNNTTLSHLIC